MTRGLLISVRLHDGRYHGAGEWPPAPARLFQALVAGAGLSGPLTGGDREALEWLEALDAPIIGAPRKRDGTSVTLYVPNNDLDSVGGNPRSIAEIRGSQKVFKPRLFDASTPLIYAWLFEETGSGARNAATISQLAERLYQFGRGIDFACAWAEELAGEALEERLSSYPGTIHRRSLGGTGSALKCPAPRSLRSLDDRYRATERRFRREKGGRTIREVFTKLPSPRFAMVPYDSPASRYVFELRERSDEAGFAAWPLAEIGRLVELLRDGAATRLRSAFASQGPEIDRSLVGRKPDGTNDGPTSDRARILPLPSIGHHHADRCIRRVLIDVPPDCPLRPDDVQWAFSGLELSEGERGNPSPIEVTPAAEANVRDMLTHYGIGKDEAHRRWRTVTPAALPQNAERRRIDPNHLSSETKDGRERAEECQRAAGAVVQALRHAAVRAPVQTIRVQREPFEANGERVEVFAKGTRFSKHRLWHVEIQFREVIPGPLILGDGRFLGLGLMAPWPDGVTIAE